MRDTSEKNTNELIFNSSKLKAGRDQEILLIYEWMGLLSHGSTVLAGDTGTQRHEPSEKNPEIQPNAQHLQKVPLNTAVCSLVGRPFWAPDDQIHGQTSSQGSVLV